MKFSVAEEKEGGGIGVWCNIDDADVVVEGDDDILEDASGGGCGESMELLVRFNTSWHSALELNSIALKP